MVVRGKIALREKLKQYQITFEPWGLLVFLVVMAPNFLWFIFPAPKDVLRQESVTPGWDNVASVAQVLMTAALCFLKNRCAEKLSWRRPLILGAAGCCLCYDIAWVCYYSGVAAPVVILALCLSPCVTFFLFSLDRKNVPAAMAVVLFTLCHTVYGVINFIC